MRPPRFELGTPALKVPCSTSWATSALIKERSGGSWSWTRFSGFSVQRIDHLCQPSFYKIFISSKISEKTVDWVPQVKPISRSTRIRTLVYGWKCYIKTAVRNLIRIPYDYVMLPLHHITIKRIVPPEGFEPSSLIS